MYNYTCMYESTLQNNEKKDDEKKDDEKMTSKQKMHLAIFMTIFVIITTFFTLKNPESKEKIIKLTKNKNFLIFLGLTIFSGICIKVFSKHKNINKAFYVAFNAFIIALFAYLDNIISAFWYIFILVIYKGEV